MKDDKHFHVPKVFEELSTDQVLVTEYIPGVPLDKCSDLSQETRDKLGKHYVHEILDNPLKVYNATLSYRYISTFTLIFQFSLSIGY